MNAKQLQREVFSYCNDKGIYAVVPNAELLLGESDVLCVTASGYAYEFEIKISRSDLSRDYHKQAFGGRGVGWGLKHDLLQSKECLQSPRRFYFVTTPNVIKPEDVRDHCGLLLFKNGGLEVAKKAPVLPSQKLTSDDLRRLVGKMSCRYFSVNPWAVKS